VIIHRAYKTELKVNNQQRTLCHKHAGCARFAYNWGLQRKIEEYEKTGKSPNAMVLHRELNQLKQTHFPWMYEVSKCAPQEALRNLDRAFQHFFRRVRLGKPSGFPKFKSRKGGVGSFRLTGIIRVFADSVQLPRLGRLRLKERGYLPPESDAVHILSVTVSEKAGRWFVSLQVQEEIPDLEHGGPVVGVDVGLHRLATVSDGATAETPKVLQRYERKLRRVQRSLSRRQKGSKNCLKIRRRLQQIHARIANMRNDAIHKFTSMLAKTKSVIGVEDLNVNGMLQNHRLAKAVSDAGFYEFRRQLDYKTKWYGSRLVVVDRFYPSSKACSGCGHIMKELLLSTRCYRCERCGLVIDRDLNASYNLAAVAASSAETLNACHEVGGCRSHGPVLTDDAGTEQEIT
jgi:putative transposase